VLFRSIAEFRPALRDGRQVGHVTDLIWSPRLESNIGYVWVPIELTEPGIALQIQGPAGDLADGRTAAIPFLDPRKAIPAS